MDQLTATKAIPLSPDVKHINPNGVSALAQDVQHLTEFVSRLENGQMLRENLDELQQTVSLMQSDNHDEFFDITTRNRKYGRVDALNGPLLLEKYLHPCVEYEPRLICIKGSLLLPILLADLHHSRICQPASI